MRRYLRVVRLEKEPGEGCLFVGIHPQNFGGPEQLEDLVTDICYMTCPATIASN
jgi:hypothetical protein